MSTSKNNATIKEPLLQTDDNAAEPGPTQAVRRMSDAGENESLCTDILNAFRVRLRFDSPSDAETFCYVFVFPLPEAVTDDDQKEFASQFLTHGHTCADCLRDAFLENLLDAGNIKCGDDLRSLRTVAIEIFESLIESIIKIYEDNDELFMCVKLSAMVCEQLAEARNYPFQLSDDSLQKLDIKLTSGVIVPAYVKYNLQYKEKGFFKTKKGETTPLKNMDRVRLTYDKLSDYMNFSELRRMGLLCNVYPPHNRKVIKKLLPDWANFKRCLSPLQPLDDIRSYFGENVGFYFCFIQELAIWQMWFLIPCFPAGLITQFYPDAYGGILSVYVQVAYSVALVLWYQLFRVHWRQTEAKVANRWGMDTAMTHEGSIRAPMNPSYVGTRKPSELNENEMVIKADPRMQKFGKAFAVVVQVLYVCLIISAVSANQWFMGYQDARNPNGWTKQLCAVGLSVQIQCFDIVWGIIATKLTDMEYIRDMHEYNQRKARKLFYMKFVNMFYSFFYTAFFQWYMDPRACGYRPDEDDNKFLDAHQACFALLKTNLAFVFLSNVTFGLIGMIMPVVTFKHTLFSERRGMKAALKEGKDFQMFEVSLLEQQAKMLEYTGQDQTDDYLEIIFPVGFIVMFSMVFPFALNMLATVALLTQIRADAWKMLVAYSRPYPEKCAGIGVWNDALNRFEYFAIVVNTVLIVTQLDIEKLLFFSEYLLSLYKQEPTLLKVFLFLFGFNFYVLVSFVVKNLAPDIDSELTLTLNRQKMQRNKAHESKSGKYAETLQAAACGNHAAVNFSRIPPCTPKDKQYIPAFVS